MNFDYPDRFSSKYFQVAVEAVARNRQRSSFINGYKMTVADDLDSLKTYDNFSQMLLGTPRMFTDLGRECQAIGYC